MVCDAGFSLPSGAGSEESSGASDDTVDFRGVVYANALLLDLLLRLIDTGLAGVEPFDHVHQGRGQRLRIPVEIAPDHPLCWLNAECQRR
jgi:hypothetical protein